MQISRWESLKQQSDQLRKAERETLVTLWQLCKQEDMKLIKLVAFASGLFLFVLWL